MSEIVDEKQSSIIRQSLSDRLREWACTNQNSFHTILDILFALTIGVWCFIWSISKPYNYGPDEYVRYAMPLYIYEHGSLPRGDDPSLRNPIWGFSYAYMPFWLEPLLAALFMRIVSLFTDSAYALVVAARFVSVLAIAGTAYCLAHLLGKLFNTRVKWLVSFFIMLTPQITFLGSYVNQDSVNLLGAMMILLAWVMGLKDGWNVKNSILLSAGIVIVALSYYFGYGWILGSVILFPLSFIAHLGPNRYSSKMWKLAGLICIIVLACISFFFIRNVILYGDLLGRASQARDQALYAQDPYKPQNLALKNRGYPVTYLLRDTGWWKSTMTSYVGCFGYMAYRLPGWFYGVYLAAAAYLIAMTCMSTRFVIADRRWTTLTVGILTAFEFILPILLCYWYSYATDYEPQGRYIMALTPAFALMCAHGVDTSRKHPRLKTTVIIGMIILLALYVFKTVYIASGPNPRPVEN